MHRAFFLFLLGALIPGGSIVGQDLGSTNEFVVTGEIRLEAGTGLVIATNGVVITRGETMLKADRAVMNRQTGEIDAEGNVQLQRGPEYWTGERLFYNFNTHRMDTEAFRTGFAPFFLRGETLQVTTTNQVYVITNVIVTLDDIASPAYTIRARELTVSPGQFMKARQARLYVKDVPVLYLPYYRRRLDRHPNNFEFTPGYRSVYGPFLLSTYNWMASTNLRGAVHLDLREKRGIGFGPEFDYNIGRLGYGHLDTYYIKDEQPEAAEEINKILPGALPQHRERITFWHRVSPQSNLTATVMLRQQSDPRITRDFFETEYREHIRPNSFLEINKFWSNYNLNVFTQPQINDFFETIERLPEVKLGSSRQQLGHSPLYYESDSSAGYFRRKFANDNQPEYEAARGDTFHQIVLPQNLFGWLNLTPRVGGRWTYYTEAEGPGATTFEKHRGVFNTGMEGSFKASRVWPEIKSRFWEVNGIRHILEPSVNYVFVPRPSPLPPQLPQFDYELASRRLLPIDYPDYNAIDAIDSQNVLRIALRNKLQTKRVDLGDPTGIKGPTDGPKTPADQEGIENLVHWALYTDWRLDPRPGQTTFADIYSDLDLQPFHWVTLNSETRFDVKGGNWRELNHTMTLSPGDVWSFEIGHRYLRNDPGFGANSGHNLVRSSIYYRFNENWAAHILHHYDLVDGRMQEQFYTLYRDLRSWTAALTFRIREPRNQAADFTVAITFSLKAFPRFGLGKDRERPSLLLGR